MGRAPGTRIAPFMAHRISLASRPGGCDRKSPNGRLSDIRLEPVGNDSDVMDTLAAAYAASGTFPEAMAWQQKAIASTQSDSAKKEFSERLAFYKQGEQYIQKK